MDEVLSIKGHQSPVWSLDISSNNKRVASGSEDGILKIWEVDSGTEVSSFGEHNGKGLCICREIDFWASERKIVAHCPVTSHSKGVTTVQFIDEGAQLISRSHSG
ncbi:hypothetical protein T484DRAFT_1902222, partial [Baffinella frigidus]